MKKVKVRQDQRDWQYHITSVMVSKFGWTTRAISDSPPSENCLARKEIDEPPPKVHLDLEYKIPSNEKYIGLSFGQFYCNTFCLTNKH